MMARNDLERPARSKRTIYIEDDLWGLMRQAAQAQDVGEDMPSRSALLRRYIVKGLEGDSYTVPEGVKAAMDREDPDG